MYRIPVFFHWRQLRFPHTRGGVPSICRVMGLAQAYDIMDDLRSGVLNCEFGIYLFGSNPKLVERCTDPVTKFIEGPEFGS